MYGILAMDSGMVQEYVYECKLAMRGLNKPQSGPGWTHGLKLVLTFALLDNS